MDGGDSASAGVVFVGNIPAGACPGL